jgi:molybdate transport system substrate-binding protein
MSKLNSELKYTCLLIIMSFFSCSRGEEVPVLNIATAANMQFAMEELVSAFSKKTNIKCQTIISSSGKLTAQIKAGAPYDVFLSANMKYPSELYKSGKTIGKPAIYAYGQLILWTIQKENYPKIEDLTNDFYKKIALANTRTAPYGMAAMQTLEYFKIKEKVEKKLVFGESIAQTNQFIISGAADIGFTAQSVIKSEDRKNLGNWITVPKAAYQPIEQGIVILNNREEQIKNAQLFHDFLFTEEAKDILEDFGYMTSL